MIEIVPAGARHAAIAPYLRRADVEEIWASSGVNPTFAVAYSIAHSKYRRAVLLNRKPVVLFGVGELPGSSETSGVPWLVATDEIEKHPVTFYRRSKSIISEMKHNYEYLTNWVDARNTLSLRWLKWSGFDIEDPAPFGSFGLMFHKFTWRRK